MATRILLNGCNGRMGRVISESLQNNPECYIACGMDLNTVSHFSYPVFSSITECNVDFDVIIDFSHPAAFDSVYDMALSHMKPVVIATTGLSLDQKLKYSELSNKVPVFVSANMSLGINMLIKLAAQATEILAGEFDIEIVEAHHNLKIDAPSGTAIMIADAIINSSPKDLEPIYDRHELKSKRSVNELGIHSVRGGTIVGDHTIIFAGKEEVIELTHRAQSRNVFAQGAIAAARFISTLSPGLYSMTDLINRRSSDTSAN